MSAAHEDHVDHGVYADDCAECQRDATAVDWLEAVRKFGIEQANRMFP